MLDHKMHTFLTLCETMNYTLAAQRLHVTQPAVTQHIRALESQYNCKLFTYDGKKLKKTPQGELLERSGNAMRYQEARTLEAMQNSDRQHLSIGATKTIGEFVIPHLVANFLQNPRHTLRVEVDNTEKILALIDKGELDFALIEGFFNKSHYGSRLYRKEPFVGLCSIHHPLAGRTIPLSRVFRENLFLREEGSGTRKILEDVLAERNHTIDDFSRVTCISNFGLLEHLVAEGIGITFAGAAIGDSNPALTRFFVEDWDVQREFNYVYLPNAGAEPLIALFEGQE